MRYQFLREQEFCLYVYPLSCGTHGRRTVTNSHDVDYTNANQRSSSCLGRWTDKKVTFPRKYLSKGSKSPSPGSEKSPCNTPSIDVNLVHAEALSAPHLLTAVQHQRLVPQSTGGVAAQYSSISQQKGPSTANDRGPHHRYRPSVQKILQLLNPDS